MVTGLGRIMWMREEETEQVRIGGIGGQTQDLLVGLLIYNNFMSALRGLSKGKFLRDIAKQSEVICLLFSTVSK